MTDERIAAIREVRVAAHELQNVCAALVGGTIMALSVPVVDTIAKPQHNLVPHRVEIKEK